MNRKKRAVIGAAVAAVLPLSALATTASASPRTSAPVQIQFWNNFTGTGPLGNELGNLVNEFNSTHPGIEVQPVYQAYATMQQTLESAVAAGDPPAIAQIEMTAMAPLADDGALQPLDNVLGTSSATALEKTYLPSIVKANSYNGTLYGVPFGYNSNVLYYNKKLVAGAGIKKLPTTWSELEADSEQIYQHYKHQVYGYAVPADAPWVLEVRFWQAGAQMFGAYNTSATFNSAQGVAMFKDYQQLLASKSAVLVQNDSALDQLTDLFAAGKVAMFEQSSTAVQNITESAKFPIGESQFPTVGQRVFSLGGYNLGIFKGASTAEQQAAGTFAQWWASPQVAAQWTTASNYMPGITKAWTTNTLIDWEKADPRREVAADEIPYSHRRPDFPAYPQISTYIADAFEATMEGQGSAQKNLDKAAAQADQVIASGGN